MRRRSSDQATQAGASDASAEGAPRARRWRRRRRPPLVIVDLETAHDPKIGALTVAAIHRHVAPEAPMHVLVPGGPMELLAQAGQIVVTGSSLMLEDVPWASGLAHEIAHAAAGGTPVLAICFGHQMMARHFGGRIASFSEVRKGVQEIRFDGAGPFPHGAVPLIHTHRDHVVDSGELVPCAEGGFGGIAATRHPEWPVYTVQGHPEWDATVARADDPFWERLPDEDLATADAKRILTRFGQLSG